MAENLADEVIRASTDFDGTERAPMRLAEARITFTALRIAEVIRRGELLLGAIDPSMRPSIPLM
jgi:hypothetical protein